MMHKNKGDRITNTYEIKGDCDFSVGDIAFDGTVHIAGGVCSGCTIKATGSIVIAGVVKAATLIAGGDVEIKSGMQGAGKGMIKAGGSVSALYIERGHVVADGSITLDASIHSVIEAGQNIITKGKRGAIIGGKAFATGYIVANYIGAVSNTKTEIVAKAVESKVHVRDLTFAGSLISIGLATYKVNREIQFATFEYRNGEIAYYPYELRS